ncbi:MAG: hypothetical protein RL189_2161, partial [Pseudomonadota bacterium]
SQLATRQGTSALNININVSQRIHQDFWLGVSAFSGYDPAPAISRNHDQSIGIITHWFPFSLSSDSSVTFEGFQLSESQTYRPFVYSNLSLGRALIRRILNNFEATSDYLGVGVGSGLQIAITPSFSLAASAGFQANIGLSEVPYSGQRISAAMSAVLQY